MWGWRSFSTFVTTPSVFAAFVALHRTRSPTFIDHLQILTPEDHPATTIQCRDFNTTLTHSDHARFCDDPRPIGLDPLVLQFYQITDFHLSLPYCFRGIAFRCTMRHRPPIQLSTHLWEYHKIPQ